MTSARIGLPSPHTPLFVPFAPPLLFFFAAWFCQLLFFAYLQSLMTPMPLTLAWSRRLRWQSRVRSEKPVLRPCWGGRKNGCFLS
ncbi:hypothetical protein IWZ00DRAFT_343642 [Phyllosticta capitalensis]